MKESVRRPGVISILPFVLASLLILLSAKQSRGQGQPGTLDTSFNGTGQVLTDFSSLSGSVNSAAQAVAIQADGKIVAAGYSYPDLALARYNTDGSLDTSFNGTGRTVTAYAPGCCASAQAVAIQGDGKIVTAGSPNFALGRYNTDGSLDTTFNGTGQVSAILTAMAIQADGKIVTAGYGGGYFVLARSNTDGTLDTSFNGTGQVWTAFSGAAFASAQAVAVQGDGKILAAGAVNISGAYYSGLARYNANGTLDTTFNGTGQVLTTFSGDTVSYSVTVQLDSKIVTAGSTTVSGTGEFWLARYNTDGTLDAGFNGTGQVATPFSSGATDTNARAVAILADGKIVAAGYSSSGHYQVALAQYNTNGTLDTSFNGTGQVLTSFPGYTDNLALSEAIQADGKVVTAGYVFGNGLGQSFFALARYNGGPTCDPAPSGLVAWWPAEGNADDVHGGNNGTLVNGATFGPGKVGQAFSLDGVSSYIDLGNASMIGSGNAPFSVSMWINPTRAPSSWYYLPIRLKQDSQFILAIIRDFVFSGDYVGLGFRGVTAYWIPTNVSNLVNNWTHLVAEYKGGDKSDPANYAVFFNGVQLPTGSVNQGTIGGSCNDSAIGSDCGGGAFPGLLDEVQIFNRALSQSEIEGIFGAGSAGIFEARIAVGGPTSFCPGGSVTLTANSGVSYIWSTGETTQAITATAPNSYSVTVTSPEGCAATSDAVTVTVNPSPTAVASGSAAICAASSTTLSGSGGVSCSWLPITGLSNANSCSPSASPSATTTYALTATDANGCTSTNQATVTVTVKSVPAITWANPGSIVYGTALGAAQLNATSSVPGAFSYSPAPGTVLDAGAAQTLSVTFTPTDPSQYCAATATVTINVTPAPLNITASNATKVYGAPLPVFSATASGFVNGDSMTSLGGALTFTTPATAASSVGTYAVNPGGVTSPNYTISFMAGTLTITQASTTTLATSSSNPSAYSQMVTFTAAVAPVAPGAGSPTGTVTFKDGSATLGTPAAVSNGQATYTTSTLTAGTHSISAVYGGDSSFSGSVSTAFGQKVSAAITTIIASSTPNPSVYGQSVTFSAAVSSTAGTPTGSVTFSEGKTTLAIMNYGGGVQTFPLVSLAAGAHTIMVQYTSFSGNFAASSTTIVQTVSNAATTTTLTSSPNPAVYSQSVTFTATVKPVTLGGTTPTGAVTFTDGASPIVTFPLNSSGVASLGIVSLSAGSHTINAIYNGSGNYSSSSGSVTQTVNRGNTSTILTSSKNPAKVGQKVTFTVSVQPVSPSTGTPTGTVNLYVYSQNGNSYFSGLLSGGVASFSFSFPASGYFQIYACYSGSANYQASCVPGYLLETVQ